MLLGRSGCPLCRLITCTYLLHNELPPDKHIELSVWWDNHYGKRSINPDVTGARCLLVGGHSGSRIIPLAKDVSDLYLGRVVNEEANVELLKAWLPRCEAFHGSDCTQSIFTEVSQPWSLDCFLLIDVHEMCLVQPQEPCHYLALSYVWGMAQTFRTTTATFNELMQQHGLAKHKHHLPNTIKDAIKITEILQQRYLWIDQLCIVQDDGIFVEAAVQNMDKIYAHAYLTLIAASGDSANSGLAGAPGRPRGPQMIEEVKPSLWLTTQPNYRLSMAASTYETRGWT